MVVPVTTATGRAALKLVAPFGDVEAEARALTVLAGQPVVSLLDADVADRALLLERIDGPPLATHGDPSVAVGIAGKVAAGIGTVPAPADAPKLATRATAWYRAMQEQHTRAQRAGTAVPDDLFRAAIGVVSALPGEATTTMTHGDLSLENILRSASGAWLAIDPLFQCGPVAHETHTVVRSLLPDILMSQRPAESMRELTRRFCHEAHVDHDGAQLLSLARYVASYYWESQHHGDPTNIQRLRRACDLTYRLLA